MRGRFSAGFVVLICSVFGIGTVSGQSLNGQRQTLAQLQSEAQRAARLADQLDAQARRETSSAADAGHRAAALAARIQATEALLTASEARLLLARKMTAIVQARLARRQQPAARLIAALQILGRRPPALGLIQPGQLPDLVHTRLLVATLLPQVRQRTSALQRDLQAQRRLEDKARAAARQLVQGRAALAAQQQALIRLQVAHKIAARRYSDTALLAQDRALAMGERARDLVDLIDQMGTQSVRQSALAALPGPVPRPFWPGLVGAPQNALENRSPSPLTRTGAAYRLPVSGRLVIGFGELDKSGVRARGLTFETRNQALVVAPRAGRIVFAGPFRSYGDIVIIDHGAGWTSLITGLSSVSVAVGDRVDTGSPMGQAQGRTPRITVELRHAGVPANITAFLS